MTTTGISQPPKAGRDWKMLMFRGMNDWRWMPLYVPLLALLAAIPIWALVPLPALLLWPPFGHGLSGIAVALMILFWVILAVTVGVKRGWRATFTPMRGPILTVAFTLMLLAGLTGSAFA